MRSSKSRSRSKTNRPRTLGNIINRVFDSSGPEGKVRGTPQQIIEKYQFLARDAQLSNDRVNAENFLQHAEHYTRLVAEANRELAAEQEARQQYQQQNNAGNTASSGGNTGGNRQQNDREPRRDERDYRSERPEYRDPAFEDQPSVAAARYDDTRFGDTGLVETPEAAPRAPRPPRKAAKPAVDPGSADGAPEAAE